MELLLFNTVRGQKTRGAGKPREGTLRELHVTHFKDAQWVNYVRGIATTELQRSIQEHLSAGCAECLEVEKLWKGVYSSAQRELDYTPPEDAIRLAKASFLPVQLEKTSALGQIAELIFDSISQPLAPAFRGSLETVGSGARTLLYQSGDIRVDMWVEGKSPNRLNVMGQVLNLHESDQMVTRAKVVLLEGERSLARTATNELGEFQLEFRMHDDMRLAIEVAMGRNVIIPLEILDTMHQRSLAERAEPRS